MREDIRESRLGNGLTILTDKMPGVRSTTLGFFFRAGSRHEPPELNGISHFIEHTVFKGTNSRSALDIAMEQERLGGNLDAFTTHEETGFAIKVIDDELPRAFDLIAEMLTDPRFDEADLKSEQKVIIEELKMVEDSPEEFLGELFSEAFFPGHPLGAGIAGTPKTVRSFDRAATTRYHRDVFHAGNLVITAAGNIDDDAIAKLARDRFENAAARKPVSNELSPPIPAAPFIVRHNPNLEQAHIIIGLPMVGAADDRRYAAELLTNVLGGGTASRLWRSIREDRGLAYSVGASTAMYQDCGVFTIFAGTSPDRIEEVIDLSVNELRQVSAEGISAQELDLAKQQYRASVLLSLEDSASRATALAHSEMVHRRQITVEETLANIDSVSLDDISQLTLEFFLTENIAFAAIGDIEEAALGREMLRLE